jgi:hypothetical protein
MEGRQKQLALHIRGGGAAEAAWESGVCIVAARVTRACQADSLPASRASFAKGYLDFRLIISHPESRGHAVLTSSKQQWSLTNLRDTRALRYFRSLFHEGTSNLAPRRDYAYLAGCSGGQGLQASSAPARLKDCVS